MWKTKRSCLGLLPVVLLAGCGPKVMPKGGGASGRLTAIADQADLGLELINKLTAEQKKSYDWLRQPFAQAALPGARSSAAAKQQLRLVAEAWETVILADVAQGRNGARIRYTATLLITHGSLVVQLSSDTAPLQVRGLVALAKTGFFKGSQLQAGEGLIWLGSAEGADVFKLPAAVHDLPIRQGLLVCITAEAGQPTGTRFAICTTDQPALEGRATIVGSVVNSDAGEVVGKIQQALKKEPGSVRIEQVKIATQTDDLFMPMGQVNLPMLDKDGRVTLRRQPAPGPAPGPDSKAEGSGPPPPDR